MHSHILYSARLTKLLALGIIGLFSMPAMAGFTVYTDQASFLAAAGSVSTETFDTITADTVASSAGTTIHDLTLSGSAYIDAPSTAININGSTNLYFDTSHGGWADLTFSQPITAFGLTMSNQRLQLLSISFDRSGPGYGEYHHIATYAAPDPFVSNQSLNGFIGFTSDVAFNRIVFAGAGCCSSTFAVDNVAYATTLATPVPEPISASLLGLGIVGLCLLRRHAPQ